MYMAYESNKFSGYSQDVAICMYIIHEQAQSTQIRRT